MVDFFCSEYGWTVDEIFDHCIEELELLIKVAQSRKEKQAEYDASLHQVEFKKSNASNHNMDNLDALDSMKKQGFHIEDV